MSTSTPASSRGGEIAAIVVVVFVLLLVGPPLLYFTIGPHLSDLSKGMPGSASGVAQVEGGRRGNPLLILHHDDGERTIFRCSLEVRDRRCFRMIRQAGLRDGDRVDALYLTVGGIMGSQPIVLAVRSNNRMMMDCSTSLYRLGLRSRENVRTYCSFWME